MHELDGHTAFAHSRSHASHGTSATVAGGEEAGHAGFEQVGLAVFLPRLFVAWVTYEVAAGEEVAFGVANGEVTNPLGAGLGPDEDK
jgi:hypothetical protein